MNTWTESIASTKHVHKIQTTKRNDINQEWRRNDSQASNSGACRCDFFNAQRTTHNSQQHINHLLYINTVCSFSFTSTQSCLLGNITYLRFVFLQRLLVVLCRIAEEMCVYDIIWWFLRERKAREVRVLRRTHRGWRHRQQSIQRTTIISNITYRTKRKMLARWLAEFTKHNNSSHPKQTYPHSCVSMQRKTKSYCLRFWIVLMLSFYQWKR